VDQALKVQHASSKLLGQDARDQSRASTPNRSPSGVQTPRQTGSIADAEAEAKRPLSLIVEGMRCGGCMATVERALRAEPGVVSARVNLAAKRVAISFDPGATSGEALVEALAKAGFRAAETVGAIDEAEYARGEDLLRRLGVAGFATANVMLLSVSVWAGAASDMEAGVRDLFHWLSALIAMPAIAYSALPFFRSGFAALRSRRLNMDVPISLGILLATGMSLFQTWRGGGDVYFDAAIMLTFFLLIGRYLDEFVRARARGAAENLLGMQALVATVVAPDGSARRLPAGGLEAGMCVQVAQGERIPVDGRLVDGQTEIEESLITGETLPRFVEGGEFVYAGSLNLQRPILVEALATHDTTLVAQIARMMQNAEQGRGEYVRLADRAARLYAPAVHGLGALTFAAWMIVGAGWEQALTYAIAVLIITCPCALGLAVPAVQVSASSRLFRKGIILKAADGLERLGDVDTVVFDKTGTLTLGAPVLLNSEAVDDLTLSRAASLAAISRHPYSKAIVAAARERGLAILPAADVSEIPGAGLSCPVAQGEERLGSARWVLGACTKDTHKATLWYKCADEAAVAFIFEDAMRSDAPAVVAQLRRAGYCVALLSGDRESIVQQVAEAVGIDDWKGAVRPDEKLDRLRELGDAGRRVLMVGDGLNDAPALAAAHASLAPSTAADISQTAADAVFQGLRLAPIVETLAVARATRKSSFENFAIAIGYNVLAVPFAMLGYVTPLFAALAMSMSSIAVTGNAARLGWRRLALFAPRRVS
jgi:P-type Cu2+ transporter